jgi:type III secretion system low calcium response chaperone LcrH/SycD
MKGEQQQIKKSVDAVGKQVREDQDKQLKDIVKRVKEEGAFPKDALGLSDSMVEGIYGQAYRLYNTGKYQDAGQLFRLLVLINSMEAKYSMGLAACFHMSKDYDRAVEAYALNSIIDPDSPIPHFHSSDCYLQMKDKVSALIALEMAVKRAGDKPEYHVLKDRALMTIKSIKEELEKAKKI